MLSESMQQRMIEKQYRAHLALDKQYSGIERVSNSNEKPFKRQDLKSDIYTMDEIAGIVGISKQRCKVLLKQALEKCRVYCEENNVDINVLMGGE